MSGIISDNLSRSSGLVKGVATPSSDFVKLATVSVSAAATVSIDGYFSGTYKRYYLYWEDIYPDASSTYLRMRYNASGSAITASNYRNASAYFSTNAGSAGHNAEGYYDVDYFYMTQDGSSDHGTQYSQNGWLVTNNDPLGTTAGKAFTGQAYVPINGGGTYNWHHVLGGVYNTTPAISGFTFYWSTGDNFVAQGDFQLYGVK